MAFRSFTEPAVAPAPHYLTDGFQRALAHWNHERLAPQFPSADWEANLQRDSRMQRLEGNFLEQLRAEVVEQAASAPTDPDGFIGWFERLKENGPGQGDPLFPWLAEKASREDISWFLEQEAAGEAGFDDRGRVGGHPHCNRSGVCARLCAADACPSPQCGRLEGPDLDHPLRGLPAPRPGHAGTGLRRPDSALGQRLCDHRDLQRAAGD